MPIPDVKRPAGQPSAEDDCTITFDGDVEVEALLAWVSEDRDDGYTEEQRYYMETFSISGDAKIALSEKHSKFEGLRVASLDHSYVQLRRHPSCPPVTLLLTAVGLSASVRIEVLVASPHQPIR